MNTHTRRRGLSAKLIVLLLAAIMVASVFTLHISGALASSNDIVVTLKCESGINTASHIEVGQTQSLSVTYLFRAKSIDTSLATVAFTAGSTDNNLTTTGVKAGVAGIAFGTKAGAVETWSYQITDSNNVSAYRIKDGGEVYFLEAGKTKPSPVTVTAGDFGRITWKSMNDKVATVSSNGSITSEGLGAAIITGSFIDKWGVPRDLHLLVGVGVKLSDSDLGKLLELVKEGEKILNNDSDKYTEDSLGDLQDAVDKGKEVLGSDSPSDQDIGGAVKDLEDALAGLEENSKLPPGVIGPDEDGNYYKPVGDPDNVYEVVDENGGSKEPPEYVYNPGNPVTNPENNRPAYPKDDLYYVEDPEGSNIYKEVGEDGALIDSPAIWGGPDGKLGGGDDEPVINSNGDYWVDLGQNIWQKADELTLGPQVCPPSGQDGQKGNPGGPNDRYDIVENGGEKYLGPNPDGSYQKAGDDGLLGTPDDTMVWQKDPGLPIGPGNESGHKAVTNITISPATATATAGNNTNPPQFTAKVFFFDGTEDAAGVTWSIDSSNSSLVSQSATQATLNTTDKETKQTLTITATSKTDTSRKATATVTVQSKAGADIDSAGNNGTVKIDNIDWFVKEKDGDYAFLVAKNYNSVSIKFDSNSSNYEGSALQGSVTSFYKGLSTIKSMAVLPSWPGKGGSNMLSSKTDKTGHTTTMAGSTEKDVCFALSYADLENWDKTYDYPTGYYWSRTAISSNTACEVNVSGHSIVTSTPIITELNMRPGVWVKYK